MSLENYDCTATVKRWRRLSQRHLHRLICCSRGSPHAPSKFATLHHLECFPHEDAQGPGVLVPLPALGGQQERRRKRLASGCCNIRSGPQGGGLESSTLPGRGRGALSVVHCSSIHSSLQQSIRRVCFLPGAVMDIRAAQVVCLRFLKDVIQMSSSQ